MPKLHTWSGDWSNAGGMVVPMQAWADQSGDFELLKSRGGALLVGRRAVAPMRATAPASTAPALVVSAAALHIIAARLDPAAGASVMLLAADGVTPVWPLAPGDAFTPPVPLLFAAGLAIRSTGLTPVVVYLQTEAA